MFDWLKTLVGGIAGLVGGSTNAPPTTENNAPPPATSPRPLGNAPTGGVVAQPSVPTQDPAGPVVNGGPAPAGGGLQRGPDLGLATMGTRPDPADRQTTREQWQEQSSRARAVATLAAINPDQPLENPNPNAATEGHGHARHGFDTTDAQQADRVVTGRYPDQAPTETPGGAPAARASRFGSPQQEVEALRRGEAEVDRRSALPAGDPGAMPSPAVDPVTNAPARQPIVVDTNRPGGFGTSQVVQRQPPPSNQPQLDTTGSRVATPSATPLPEANMVYEFVPSTGQWQLVTYHPQPAVDPATGQRPLR